MKCTVVVATYNPNINKLRATLDSICAQDNCQMQIVITDDGSNFEYNSWIQKYFENKSVENYIVITHETNVGTIKNIIDGIEAAENEYIYLTSPGDCLFSPNSLVNIIAFAKQHSADICFGDAASYIKQDDHIVLIPNWNQPKWPSAYTKRSPIDFAGTSFFFGNQFLGAACLLRKTRILPYLHEAAGFAKYMEDCAGYALALLDGAQIIYYPHIFIWYENGEGVSTTKDIQWRRILKEEAFDIIKYLRQKYPQNPNIDAAYYTRKIDNKYKSWIYRLFCHPIVFFKLVLCRLFKRKVIYVEESNLKYLKTLLGYDRGD